MKSQNNNPKDNKFKIFWSGVKAEFEARIFSSIKRISKFVGIIFVPILYAVVCILAFWNPMPNIGRASMAIMDSEEKIYIVTQNINLDKYGTRIIGPEQKDELNNPKIEWGDIPTIIGELFKDHSIAYLNDLNSQNNNSEELSPQIVDKTTSNLLIQKSQNFDEFSDFLNESSSLNNILGKNPEVKYEQKNTYVYELSTWNIIRNSSIFVNTKDDIPDTEQVFETKTVSSEEISFSNIRYLDKNTTDKKWKSRDYYVQVHLQKNMLASYINELQKMFVLNFDLVKFDKIKSIEIYTSFEHNFIFGYYLNTLNKFKLAIPMIMFNNQLNLLQELVNNISNEQLQQVINFFMDFLGINSLAAVPDLVTMEVNGVDKGLYGIGLGEFFLLIGMFVGTFMQTFIYDRAKRMHKTTSAQWYLSKTLLMLTTGVIQVSLLTIVLTAVGWHVLGSLTIFKLWLWLLLTEFVFVCTIQAIWFSLKDETIGKFIVIVYMVLNLSSGWGTFPAFMQFGFFSAVSNITEFTYSLHGMGSIIFGNATSEVNIYILQQAGILLLFALTFLTIGLLLSKNRHKEMLYGSYRKKYVLECLETLNKTELIEKFSVNRKNKTCLSWKNMPNEVQRDVVLKMRELHPFEGQFKWFKNKHHDEVLKPNYSDDDIISRNDDITV